jgi:hypothetical protein
LRGGAAKSGVTVAVVNRAFFRISQDRIRLADFFELLLRIRIIGIAVGMILQRELAIGALQFSLGDRPGDAENFVVIAFCVCGQKWPFLVNTKWSLLGMNVVISGRPHGTL